MSNKRMDEVRNLSKDELATKRRELELSIFQAKMKKATGQLAGVSSLWRMRKDLARVKMLECEMGKKVTTQAATS